MQKKNIWRGDDTIGQETVTLSVRLTVAQREKLERLGGAVWLRDRIDKAKEPA